MCLGADAVVLVFYQRVLEILESLGSIGRGAGQHEADGMKQPHARVVQPVFGGELQGFADVAQQHVRALHLRQRLVVGFGDRLLDQALLQPDSQVAGDDLQDVLGFERSGALEALAAVRLWHWPFGLRQSDRRSERISGERQRRSSRACAPASPCCWANLGSTIDHHAVNRCAQIARLAIPRAEFVVRSAGDFLHYLPQQRAADLQRAFFECRKSPARQEHRRDRRVFQIARTEILSDDAVFSSFFVVAPMRSQVSASFCISPS